MDLDLQVARLRLSRESPWDSASAHLFLADGRLRVDPLLIGLAGQTPIAIAGSVDASGTDAARWLLELAGKSIKLDDVLERLGAPGVLTGGEATLTLELAGRGNTVHAIAASLDGTATLESGPAVLHHRTSGFSAGLLRGLAEALNPFHEAEPDTRLQCIGIRLPVSAGVVSSDRAAALEADKFGLVASGTIDLRTEAIDVGVVPVLAQGVHLSGGAMAQLVRVDGTLAQPRIDTNVGGAATRGAMSMGAAVATGGITLLFRTLAERAGTDPHPCTTALRE